MLGAKIIIKTLKLVVVNIIFLFLLESIIPVLDIIIRNGVDYIYAIIDRAQEMLFIYHDSKLIIKYPYFFSKSSIEL